MTKKKGGQIGNSTNLVIGGKTYNSQDISHFKLKEKEITTVKSDQNAPRDVQKKVINEANTIHTQHSDRNIIKETESIKSSNNLTTKNITGNIKTGTNINDENRNNVQNYNNQFNSINVTTSAEIKVVDSKPQNTVQIKTSEVNKTQQSVSGIPKDIVITKGSLSVSNVVSVAKINTNNTNNIFQETTIASYNSDTKFTTSSKIVTGKTIEYQAESRAYESSSNLQYRPNILNKVGNEFSTTLSKELAKYEEKKVPLRTELFNELKNGVYSAGTKSKSYLMNKDDFGSQYAGKTIEATMAGASVFSLVQKTSEVISPPIDKVIGTAIGGVGKGTWEVATTTKCVGLTVVRTAKIMNQSQFSLLSKDTLNTLKSQSLSTGLINTSIAKTIVHRVEEIKNRITDIKTKAIKTKDAIYKGTVKVKGIVRGVVKGTVTIKIPHELLKRARMRAVLGVKKGIVVSSKVLGKSTIRGSAKLTAYTLKKGIPFTKQRIKSGVTGTANYLTRVDNYAVQGVGYSIKLGQASVKTAVLTAKTTGATVKTSIKIGKNLFKAGKTTWAFAAYIKNKGLKAAWDKARSAAIKKTIQAGKSMITALINVAKLLGKKIIIPIILICAVVIAVSGVITTPIMAIGSIFGGVFGTSEGNEYDISDYLNDPVNGIPAIRDEYINNLASEMQNSASSYDIVRFYANNGGSSPVSPNIDGIKSVFPSNQQIINMVQPIFNAVILMDYDLEPTESQAKQLLKDIFNTLFTVETVSTIEQCGQDLATGEGTVQTHSCGNVHAFGNCPNVNSGNHSSLVCDDCCEEYCDGHQSTCDEENCTGHTSYCGHCKFRCSGYSYCGGHSVLTYKLNMDGIYTLIAKYFTNPIDVLANIENRTSEEEEKLQTLKDYYEICLEYMNQLPMYSGGGMTMEDLSGVEFINGSRNSGQGVVDLALSQQGQVGGEPYWRYLGFSSRVEWCACFVTWVMGNSSQGSSYPNTSNNAYCPTVSNWFKDNGRWGGRDFTDLVAGDTIFFDWEGDGTTDHIGIVIGRDATTVYTIEGNSGDAVNVRSYQIGSSVIYGYGLMNY